MASVVASPFATTMISIIIPTLNEASRIGALLARLRAEPVACEAIVVDGGSTDDTLAIVRASGWARGLTAMRGRGQQLVAGAAAAQGDVLLFLHADTVFPMGGLVALDRVLAANPDSPGGNFRLEFDGHDGFSAWLTDFYAWLRRRGFYYGDSGIFVRRAAYDALGGLRPIALMEDFDFVRRMERAGKTLCIDNPPLETSSRRFAGRPPWRIVMGWVWLHAGYLLGVAPTRLARAYDSERRTERGRTGARTGARTGER